MELNCPKVFIKIELNNEAVVKKVQEVPIENGRAGVLSYLENLRAWNVYPFLFKNPALQERAQLTILEKGSILTKNTVKPYKISNVIMINTERMIGVEDIEFPLYCDRAANWYVLEEDFYLQVPQ